MGDVYDFRAAGMSWAQVDASADSLRASLKLSEVPYFPIVEVVEKLLGNVLGAIDFMVLSPREMGDAEGLTCPRGEFISIREDVYDQACSGGARARFTFAHELGHLLLHADPDKPLARATPSDRLRPFESAEKQANRYASALLMPEQHITYWDEESDLVQRFGVSSSAAKYRLKDIKKRKGFY